MEIYGRHWSGSQETLIPDDETIIEEVTSWKLRSRNNKYRIPKTSHIPPEISTEPPEASAEQSTHKSDTRSKKKKKKSKSSYKVDGVEATPSVRSSASCSSCSGCSQKSGLESAGLLEISCCSHTDREFWAGFKKGFRDANNFRHCCDEHDSAH
ncbi:hypothetical protein TWF970_004574 [Orbilia oligospora]|uniref:Uncharacterized protein n=1 Tax=Orbilia oligospora TaxID=2813651 RepID=A0A7C8RDF2_ORBOL|nr:hypothetical protein TWF970_004574 [Orbilia oligospora]